MSYIEYDELKKKKSYQPKEVTPERALAKLMKLCSLSEKSVKDAKELLIRWKVDELKRGEIIQYLVSNRYIDDSRFAAAYVRDKSNFSAWGTSRIKMGLRAKGISSDIIDYVMSNIDDQVMQDKIERSLDIKMRGLKYKDKYDLRNKLLRFAFSRGYDMEQATDYLNKIIKDLEE